MKNGTIKFKINNHKPDECIQDSGETVISVYDSQGNEYRISQAKFGGLEINGCDGGFLIETNTSNLIYLHQK